MATDDLDNTALDRTVIDLGAYVAKKKQRDCQHLRVEVDDAAAELACLECGADLDVWWYMRRLASDEVEQVTRIKKYESEIDRLHKRAHALSVRYQAELDRQHEEIRRLIETKNRLWNEQIQGRPLGSYVGKRRRRTLATGKTT